MSAAAVTALLAAGCLAPFAPPAPSADTTAPVASASPRTEQPLVAADVVRVTDGDTIVVRIGEDEHRVRYIGIDAPEEAGECLGREATEANRRLVESVTVQLERDISETDPFGRLLRYVWVTTDGGWLMVNRALLRRGLARVTIFRPDDRYAALFAADEEHARANGLGVWGAC